MKKAFIQGFLNRKLKLLGLSLYERAMALTQSTQLIEDKLLMLAIMARNKKEKGLSPDPEILDQIKSLYSKIDFSTIRDRSIEISRELVYTLPDLAIDIIERSVGADNTENSLDWAYASLSFSAINSANSHPNSGQTNGKM